MCKVYEQYVWSVLSVWAVQSRKKDEFGQKNMEIGVFEDADKELDIAKFA